MKCPNCNCEVEIKLKDHMESILTEALLENVSDNIILKEVNK